MRAAKEVDGPKGPEPTRYGDWERQRHRVGFLSRGGFSMSLRHRPG